MVKKCDSMLSRFRRIPEHCGQTDGQRDRIAVSISRVSVLTRDKKSQFSTNISLYLGTDAI